ncbi:hypothetical protein B0O99DRAFT_464231, partial [Bisporella sp. PMI_857]
IIIFALVFVAARIFVRKRWGTGIATDDWVIVASTVFFLVLAGLNLLMIEHGVGLHLVVVSAEDFTIVLQSLMGSECAYTMTIALTKISILLMYCRIFPIKSMKKGAVVLGCITIAWAIAVLLISIFQCTPIRKTWLPTLPYGHCINLKACFMGNALPNILTDIAILSLPIPQVWGLHTSVSRKISLTIVFLLGSFVIGASIYRFVTLLTFDTSDLTYTTAAPSIWTVVEAAAGLVSACLPTFGPVFQLLKQKLGIETLTSASKRKSYPLPIDLITIGGGRWKSGADSFHRLEDTQLGPDIEVQKGNASTSAGSDHLDLSEKGDSGDELPLYR